MFTHTFNVAFRMCHNLIYFAFLNNTLRLLNHLWVKNLIAAIFFNAQHVFD